MKTKTQFEALLLVATRSFALPAHTSYARARAFARPLLLTRVSNLDAGRIPDKGPDLLGVRSQNHRITVATLATALVLPFTDHFDLDVGSQQHPR